MSASARAAALELLVFHDLLDLPPPAAAGTHSGLSGESYQACISGKPYRARIVSRCWIDNQSATLTLDDGRTVLVHMRTTSCFESESQWDAVVAIRVSDPDVAGWPPEEILRQIRLNPEFTCWDRHWQMEELQRQAAAAAEQLAVEAGDTMPPSLAGDGELPPASEGLVHWVVKKLLSKAGRIRVPEASRMVEIEAAGGQRHSAVATVPSALLELRDVRVEHRLPGFIPDIICIAQDASSLRDSFEMLVEVAVTHNVDEAKLQKIRQHRLGCLELDATRFGVRGRVRVRDLSVEVVTDLRNKRWLYHPQLDAEVKRVESELRSRAEQGRQALLEQERRAAWLRAESENRVREHYLRALGSRLGCTTIEGREWGHVALAQALTDKGWPGASDELLAGEEGVVRCLAAIKAVERGTQTDIEPVLEQFLTRHCHQQFATLVSIAFKVYSPRLTEDQRSRLDRANEHIVASLKALNRALARPTRHDKYIAFLFPEMADALKKAFGTREKVEEELRNVQAREVTRQEQQRAADLELDKERLRMLDANALERAIVNAYRPGWQQPLGFTQDADQILALAVVKSAVRTYARNGIDAPALIRSACEARSRGVPLDAWFRAQSPQNLAEVQALHNLLRVSWLVVDEAPVGRR